MVPFYKSEMNGILIAAQIERIATRKDQVWKDIPNYEGFYQVSDLGLVRSLDRFVNSKKEGKKPVAGQILKQYLKGAGYLQVALFRNQKSKYFLVHRLVYQVFAGETILQVDHINNIKTDNRLCNLQALSQTDNNIKAKALKPKTSKYPGVYRYGNKWKAQVGRNGKKISLGYFENEEMAFEAYQNARVL